MKIAVIGVGFVGGTVADFLEHNQHEVIRVDPKYYDTTIEEATAFADAAIVCVNTPMYADGSCDGARISHVCEAIAGDIPIMVKSTVTPDIVSTWDNRVVTNPEFLREAYAAEDFANQHTFVIGADYEGKPAAKFFKNLFQPLLPDCKFIVIDRATASMVKYTHNAWLATKVAWFHELYSVLPAGVDYDALTDILARFPTVGASHMQAPNSEGRLGYGGACFPKDVSALNSIIDHKILQQVSDTNDNLKKKTVNTKATMNKMKTKIPNNPFALFIGTSHTFGECDGELQLNTFAEHICSQMGLECFNVGLSGSNNIELLQIVNELNNINAFNENCKFVLLEPRLTDGTQITQIENYLPWPVVERGIENHAKANTPLLTRTKIGEFYRTDSGEMRFPLSVNDYLYVKMQAHDLTKNRIRNVISGYFDKDDIDKNIDTDFLQETLDVAQSRLAMEQKNVYSAFSDLVMVDSIKNIVTAKGIPFAWVMIDNRAKFIKILYKLYGGCTDIFDYMLFDDSAMETMVQHLDLNSIDDLSFLRCKCQHLNKQGNEILGELMLPKILDIVGK